MVDSKAPWVEICDHLDQVEGGDRAFPKLASSKQGEFYE